jgi:hypothetical protein
MTDWGRFKRLSEPFRQLQELKSSDLELCFVGPATTKPF